MDIGETHVNAKISALKELLEEIESENYTIEQTKKAIEVSLVCMKEVKGVMHD